MAPPGFENQRPSHLKNDRYTLERKVRVVFETYFVSITKLVEFHFKQIKPKCFRNVVLGGDAAPLHPHGFNNNVDQNQLRDRSTLIWMSSFST